MNKNKFIIICLQVLFTVALILGAVSPKNEIIEKYTIKTKTDGKTKFYVVTNPNNGATLSYSVDSGIKLLEEKNGRYIYAFKDMDRDETLDVWEDWRVDVDERAKDLSEKLSKKQIAGLMLFSWIEKDIEAGLTDNQREYLLEDNLRNVLNAGSNNIEAVVLWQNEMQAYVESLGEKGSPVRPVNFSTDPRSTASLADQYMVKGTEISLWPSNLGLAATFNPYTVFEYAKISSEEYRNLGIATLLGPQIDLATDPRWLRVDGTFGESVKLTTDMTEAFINGVQSTYDMNGNDLGWGRDSINVMIKHFPGDGSGEGGRESHNNAGKYAIYPGNNFDEHLIPFIKGGLNLSGKTEAAASVMTSYSIGIGADGKSVIGKRVGTAYNKEKIDILRKDNNYDGVICTDWGVTKYDPNDRFKGTAWGVENMTVAERHYEILKAGVDMFGGNNDVAPVLEAFDIWQRNYEAGNLNISAEERFRQSAERIIKLSLKPKLFENPYLDLEESKSIVASNDKVKAGYKAQLDSVVMVKNANNIIKSADINSDYKDKVVYIPSTITYGFGSFFTPIETTTGSTMDLEVAKLYFKDVVTDKAIKDNAGKIIGYESPDLSGVDMAIIGMRSPINGNNFTSAGFKDGKYYPLSLQYRPYTANGKYVRRISIAGDILEGGTQENRSYYGATSIIGNEYDLTTCLNTVKAVKEAEKKTNKKIPIIVAMKALNPVIMSEFERNVDAIVVGFSISDRALFDVILGAKEPSGLLPIQFPANMDTVEAQFEDVAFDMIPYSDSLGNKYDFAYGLNYSGVIKDNRTETYKKVYHQSIYNY